MNFVVSMRYRFQNRRYKTKRKQLQQHEVAVLNATKRVPVQILVREDGTYAPMLMPSTGGCSAATAAAAINNGNSNSTAATLAAAAAHYGNNVDQTTLLNMYRHQVSAKNNILRFSHFTHWTLLLQRAFSFFFHEKLCKINFTIV